MSTKLFKSPAAEKNKEKNHLQLQITIRQRKNDGYGVCTTKIHTNFSLTRLKASLHYSTVFSCVEFAQVFV